MKSQHLFDKVVKHLREQNAQSYHYNKNLCQYRMADDQGHILKCAIGALIPDDEYDDQMEGMSGFDLLISWPLVLRADLSPPGTEAWEAQLILLRALQCLHDNYDVDKWEAGFAYIAQEWKLNFEAKAPALTAHDLHTRLDLEHHATNYQHAKAWTRTMIEQHGRRARDNGRPFNTCPWAERTDYERWWSAGWRAMDKELSEKELVS